MNEAKTDAKSTNKDVPRTAIDVMGPFTPIGAIRTPWYIQLRLLVTSLCVNLFLALQYQDCFKNCLSPRTSRK